nr:hypothetical protein [Tanacetum cinerariifolium]
MAKVLSFFIISILFCISGIVSVNANEEYAILAQVHPRDTCKKILRTCDLRFWDDLCDTGCKQKYDDRAVGACVISKANFWVCDCTYQCP